MVAERRKDIGTRLKHKQSYVFDYETGGQARGQWIQLLGNLYGRDRQIIKKNKRKGEAEHTQRAA